MPSSPVSLADLQTALNSLIQSEGQVVLSKANLGIADLSTLLNQTVGSDLVIANTALTAADSSLKLVGTVTLFNAPFSVSLTFTMADGGFALSFSAQQAANSDLSLGALISQVAPTAKNVPALRVNSLQIAFDTKASTFLLAGAGSSWAVTLANNTATITPSISITKDGAVLTGTLVIGQSNFAVTLALGSGSQVLAGTWNTTGQPLGWLTLLRATKLESTLPIPPAFTNAGFTSAQLTLDLGSHALTLAGQTGDGEAFFSAAKGTSGWSVTIGVALAATWTPGQLSTSLKPLNVLQFQQAYLLLSSSAQQQFTFPGFDPMKTPIDVLQGLNLGAVVGFSGSLSTMLGKSTLNVQGVIGNVQSTRLSASLGGALVIPQAKGLSIGKPKLIILADGPTFEVQGELAVPLSATQIIDFTGRLGISDTKADFTLDVSGGANNQSLPAPFGFTGVTLQNIGISLGIVFTPPGVSLALEAVFAINGAHGATSSNKCALSFAVEPDAINPLLLWGQFDLLSFPLVFSAFVPKLQLPNMLNALSLQNVLVYYCEQPIVLPDGNPAVPGFAISGTLNAFKFTMGVALKINFTSGVSGEGYMSPISLAHNAVSITGHSKLGGPLVAFSTIGSPYLNVTLDAKVLDVASASVQATITDSGFRFFLALAAQADGDADSFKTTLSCWFTDPQNFGATATLSFGLHMTVGPITAPHTNVNLGTLHIGTQFAGTVSLVVTSTAITGSVTGNFDGRQLPSVSFNTPTAQLKAIPSMVAKQIRDNITSIYSDVLGDAKKWAALVSSGAITGVNDAGSVLTGFYNQSGDAAKALMQQFKLHGTVHIDTGHSDTAAKHTDGGVHVDEGKTHLDVGHVDDNHLHTDTHILGRHADTGHIDTGHSDVGGHVDTPHVDTVVTPHVDIHGDTTEKL